MEIEMDRASQAELNSALQKLADASGKTVKDVMPAQMRLFAADLAYNTRPIGKGAKDAESGRQKVAGRIGAIYKPVGTACGWLEKKSASLKAAFQRMVREGRFREAERLLNQHVGNSVRYEVGPFDDGKLHKRQQFSRNVRDGLIVTDDFRKVERYSRAKQKMVGFAKGGFATAARQLGGVRGIPGFATRQKAPGKGYVSGDGRKLSVTLVNGVDYIDKALDRAGEERAVAHRKKNINRVLKRMMDRRTKTISKSLK